MKMLFIQLHHTLNFLCFLSLPTVFAHVKLHIQTTIKSWSSFGEMMLDRNNKECIFFFSPKYKACNFIIHLGLAMGNYIFKINNRIYKFIKVLNNCFQQLLTTLFSSKTSNKSLLSEGLTWKTKRSEFDNQRYQWLLIGKRVKIIGVSC